MRDCVMGSWGDEETGKNGLLFFLRKFLIILELVPLRFA